VISVPLRAEPQGMPGRTFNFSPAKPQISPWVRKTKGRLHGKGEALLTWHW